MRVSQESDQHYHEENCVGAQNGSGACQATMCLQGEAHLINRVVRRSDLSSTYVSSYSAGKTLLLVPSLELRAQKREDVRCCVKSGRAKRTSYVEPETTQPRGNCD